MRPFTIRTPADQILLLAMCVPCSDHFNKLDPRLCSDQVNLVLFIRPRLVGGGRTCHFQPMGSYQIAQKLLILILLIIIMNNCHLQLRYLSKGTSE